MKKKICLWAIIVTLIVSAFPANLKANEVNNYLFNGELDVDTNKNENQDPFADSETSPDTEHKVENHDMQEEDEEPETENYTFDNNEANEGSGTEYEQKTESGIITESDTGTESGTENETETVPENETISEAGTENIEEEQYMIPVITLYPDENTSFGILTVEQKDGKWLLTHDLFFASPVFFLILAGIILVIAVGVFFLGIILVNKARK